ncbi:DMT family transporter [Lachnospiraceae bacterium ZAX-1]
MKKGSHAIGHLLALFTCLVWGTSFIFTKILLERFSPLEILFFRFIIGYVALWIIHPHKLKIESKKEELELFFAGFFGVTLYFLAENVALSYTLASNVGVLISVSPFFTGVLAHFVVNEKIRKSFILGFIISIFGVACISLNGVTLLKLNPIGDILAIGAAVSWAVYSNLTKKVSENPRYHIIAVTRRIFFYGLITIIPCMFFMDFSFTGNHMKQLDSWVQLIFLGLASSAICYITWNEAMKRIGTVKTSVYLYLIPVLTLLFSAIVLKEKITWVALLGTGLILSGLVLSEKTKKKDDDSDTW